jgi:hypothetical protein
LWTSGTRSRRCDTASWRTSPPVRAARSLNETVLVAVPTSGTSLSILASRHGHYSDCQSHVDCIRRCVHRTPGLRNLCRPTAGDDICSRHTCLDRLLVLITDVEITFQAHPGQFEEDAQVAIPLVSAEVLLRTPLVPWIVLLAYLCFLDSGSRPINTRTNQVRSPLGMNVRPCLPSRLTSPGFLAHNRHTCNNRAPEFLGG